MSDNRQEGLKRLAIAVGIPWVAFWGYRLVGDYRNLQHAISYRDASGLMPLSRGTEAWRAAAAEAFQHDLIWAFAPPLILVLAFWVYRGFKPRS